MAALMLGTNLYLFNTKADAATNVMVYVDSVLVNFADTPAQIIKDRTMVPVAGLAEAMGVGVTWNDIEKKVTLVSSDRYAVLVIGNNKMTYGTLADEGGTLKAATTESFTLDSPPVIVSDRSLFPASAIGMAFDAEMKWVDSTKTVFITTKTPKVETPDPVAANTPLPSVGPANPIFADTTFFQEVSAKRIQDMHDGKNKFAVVIYDGKNSDAISKMTMVKAASEAVEYKIYGYDTTGARFKGAENLKWAWDLTSQSSTDYPIILMSYEGKKDELVPSSVTQTELTAMFANLKLDYPSLTSPSPSPSSSSSASPTPSTSTSPTPSTKYSWTEITRTSAETKYDDREKFVYVLYDSNNTNMYSSSDVSRIKEAADKTRTPLYYSDIPFEDIPTSWFGYEHVGGQQHNPVVLLINKRSVSTITALSDQEAIEEKFKDFLSES